MDEGDTTFLGRATHSAAVRRLREHILRQVEAFMQALHFSPAGHAVGGATGPVPRVSIDESWANVNAKGDWNVPHSHEPVAIAVCHTRASLHFDRFQRD